MSQLTQNNLRIYKWISIGFHPLLLPSYGLLLSFTTNIVILSLSEKLQIISLCFLFTFLFPTAIALVLLKTGTVKSLEMETTPERVLPYVGAFSCNAFLSWLYNALEFPLIFSTILLASTIAILLVWCINFYWKISAHGVGIGGLLGAFLGISQRMHIDLEIILFALTIVAILIGYSRLKLKAHNTLQVVAGFVLGLVVEFLTVLYYEII
jgi:membrane-associated phospholipid phosphatase